MAIGPHLLNENFLQEVAEYEDKIDSKLSCSKIAPGGTLNLEIPSGFNMNHFTVLNERYKKAGWKDVIWNSDQREGSWLTFKS